MAERERYTLLPLRGTASARTNLRRFPERVCAPQRRQGSSSKISIKTNAIAGIAARRSLRLFAPHSSAKRPTSQEGSIRVDRDRRLARRGPDHRGQDRGVRGLVRRPVRRIIFDPPLTPLGLEITMTTPVRAALYLRVSTGRQADNDLSTPRTSAARPKPIAHRADGRSSPTMWSRARLR
jgi:hypothetical protein